MHIAVTRHHTDRSEKTSYRLQCQYIICTDCSDKNHTYCSDKISYKSQWQHITQITVKMHHTDCCDNTSQWSNDIEWRDGHKKIFCQTVNNFGFKCIIKLGDSEPVFKALLLTSKLTQQVAQCSVQKLHETNSIKIANLWIPMNADLFSPIFLQFCKQAPPKLLSAADTNRNLIIRQTLMIRCRRTDSEGLFALNEKWRTRNSLGRHN
jgi:hypothetical protein